MSEQNQPGSAAHFNKSNRNRPKTKASFAPERTEADLGLAQLPAEPLGVEIAGRDPVPATLLRGPEGAFGDGSLENQAACLGDSRLSTVQRQALAAEIGRVQGNHHLQRVIASVNGNEKTAPYQLNISKPPTGPANGTVMRKSTSTSLSAATKKADKAEPVAEEGLEEGLGGIGEPTIATGEPPGDNVTHGNYNVIYAKLIVNPAIEISKRETGQVSETVLRMPASASSSPVDGDGIVQRQPHTRERGEEEETTEEDTGQSGGQDYQAQATPPSGDNNQTNIGQPPQASANTNGNQADSSNNTNIAAPVTGTTPEGATPNVNGNDANGQQNRTAAGPPSPDGDTVPAGSRGSAPLTIQAPPQERPPAIEIPTIEIEQNGRRAESVSDVNRSLVLERSAAMLEYADLMQSRIQERATQAHLQVTEMVDAARARTVEQAAQARTTVQERYGAARQQVAESFQATQSNMQALIEQYRQQVQVTQNTEQSRLETASTQTLNRIDEARNHYDEQTVVIGDEEANRATERSNEMANQATEMGQERARNATGDEEVRREKAEELPRIANEAADQIRSIGEETADAARELGSEAQGGMDDEAAELRREVQTFTTQALARLPQISRTMLDRLATALTNILPELEAAYEQVLVALDEAEVRALENIDQSEENMVAQLDERYNQMTEAIETQMLFNEEEVIHQAQQVDSQIRAISAPDMRSVYMLAEATEGALESRASAFELAIDDAITEFEMAIGDSEDIFVSGLMEGQNSIEGQIEQLVTGWHDQLDGARTSINEQLDREFTSYQHTLTNTVDSIVNGLDEITTGMENSVERALRELRREIVATVNEGLGEARSLLNELPSRLSEAERRIDAEAEKGFWEKVWNAIVDIVSSVMFWIGVALLAALIVIAVVVSAKVALIIGLIVLAVFAVISIFNRIKSLIEEDAPWYNWVIYFAGLPAFVLLDALGFSGLIEGASGYDIVTWRELSEDERAERLAGGIVAAVMLIVSLGIAKVAPVRGMPRGGTGGRGGISRALPPGPRAPRALPPGPRTPRALPLGPRTPRALPPGPRTPRALPPGPRAPRALPPGPRTPRALPPGPEAPRALPSGPNRPLGRGSTVDPSRGRYHPRNLREQLAIEEAMQNPSAGVRAAGPLGDPRWPASEGWVKYQQTIELGGREGPISVHYNYNKVTGAVDDFKIVDRRPYVPPPEPRMPPSGSQTPD